MVVKWNFFISKFQTRLKNQKIYMSIFKANYQVGASNLTYKAFRSLSYFKCHFVRPKSVFVELQYLEEALVKIMLDQDDRAN